MKQDELAARLRALDVIPAALANLLNNYRVDAQRGPQCAEGLDEAREAFAQEIPQASRQRDQAGASSPPARA